MVAALRARVMVDGVEGGLGDTHGRKSNDHAYMRSQPQATLVNHAVAIDENEIGLCLQKRERFDRQPTFAEGEVASDISTIGHPLNHARLDNPEATVHQDRRRPGARALSLIRYIDSRRVARAPLPFDGHRPQHHVPGQRRLDRRSFCARDPPGMNVLEIHEEARSGASRTRFVGRRGLVPRSHHTSRIRRPYLRAPRRTHSPQPSCPAPVRQTPSPGDPSR